ncbi:hypothetical protein [Neobacillus sp. NPDC093127]|uniref:hypothetical protein n=1 Tax=Neobacillus sp. NPDC093127 TaxID=3364296 RepID=UPI00382B104B
MVVSGEISQLDRIEKKMDRILELLEGEDLSISIQVDGKTLAESVINEVDRLQKINSLAAQIPK